MTSPLKSRKWEGPCSTTYLFSQRNRRLFFEMAAPHTAQTQCSWNTLRLCRDIPVAPLPLACTFLMSASLFLIFVVKQLRETMSCRKTSAFHISRDSSSFQWQKEPATWLHVEGNEKWIAWARENMIRGKIIPTTTGKVGRISLAGISTGEHVRWLGWSLQVVNTY